jgi:hypothetical protein
MLRAILFTALLALALSAGSVGAQACSNFGSSNCGAEAPRISVTYYDPDDDDVYDYVPDYDDDGDDDELR